MNTPTRAPLNWIKRRARRIQRFYGVPRRIAVWDAFRDYATFFNPQQTPGGQQRLRVINGGRHAA